MKGELFCRKAAGGGRGEKRMEGRIGSKYMACMDDKFLMKPI
jgi:hypothetical protein